MGVFLHTAIVQNKGLKETKAGIQKAAKEYSNMNIFSEKCGFENSDRGVLIIFNEEANVDETLIKALSREICAPVMYLYIYDSDGWGYFYCEDGVIKDSFYVGPEDAKNTLPERYKDSAKFIAKQFHINVNEIIRYYKIWTNELIEDEAAAYENDEFVYGDCWQMVDFMKRLGIIFPNGSDNKENREAASKEGEQRQVSEPKIFYQNSSSVPYVCAFDYSYRIVLMKRYGDSLQHIIEIAELGKYRQARDELTKKIDSLKENCNSDEERALLSGMYLLRGNFSRIIGNSWQAGRDLEAAYELEPENVYILRQRVQLGTSKGKAKRAINDLNILMRIDDKNYDYYLVERAWHYYWVGEMEAARSDLMEAKNRGNSDKNDDFVFLCKKLNVKETTMSTAELVNVYQEALAPIFGDELHIICDEDNEDFIRIVLDGEREDFFFTLNGVDSLRLHWCNECFIFDKARNLLVSSDTAGEIVYEEEIDIATLPHTVIELVKYLKDAVFVSKKEQITGETPWGYDKIKKYEIEVKSLEGILAADYVIGNIRIKHCCEVGSGTDYDEFINYMKNQGWTAEMNEEQKICLPEPIKSRYTDYPERWAEFVSIVKEMVREDEKAWFLCSEDYDLQGDKAWQWNEWELLSLKAAGNDAAWKNEIKKFWDGHLPIFLSLENGYAYYAISLKEGSIVYGSEPEFEECQTVADSFEDFMKKIISGEICL